MVVRIKVKLLCEIILKREAVLWQYKSQGSAQSLHRNLSSHDSFTFTMSAAEAIAIDLVSTVILKTVVLGYHVLKNSKLYAKETQEFRTKIDIEIGIWEATVRRLRNPIVRERISPVDMERFARGSKELYNLMREFVRRHCKDKEEKRELLKIQSAEEMLDKLADEQTNIMERLSKKEQENNWGFWSGLKTELGYLLLNQSRDKKLVTEIRLWGQQLDRLSAAVIPSMVTTIDKNNKTDVANLFADTSLPELHSRGQVLLAQSVPSTETHVGDLVLDEPGPFQVDFLQLAWPNRDGVAGGFRAPTPNLECTDEDVTRELANRTDLGGKERRQWATFTKDGNSSMVIVEFKPKPGPQDARFTLPRADLAGEVDKLIRTLRLASKRKEQNSDKHPFHVLFSEGWYEQSDHFGLIYRLPSLKTTDFHCESLGSILLKNEYRKLLAKSLVNRLRLARALAGTIFELHSVNWVHESFHSDNILLFAEVRQDGYHFDWSSPYVLGFDSSRAHDGNSGKFNPKAQWIARMYTHPDRDETKEYKRYKKTYDIYALGVVLLEVGRLKSFIDEALEQHRILKDFYERQKAKANNDPESMQVDNEPHVEFTYKTGQHDLKRIFEKKTELLDEILGPVYAEIVKQCLNWHVWDRENDHELSTRFKSEVYDKLNSIKNCHEAFS